MLRDFALESPGKFLKCLFGLIVIVVLTTVLPFFDNLPWNIPSYRKAATVRECLQKLSVQPSLDNAQWDQWIRNPTPEIETLLVRLASIGPSVFPFLFKEMKKHPEYRAWGLRAMTYRGLRLRVETPFRLDLLIDWLGDPDLKVAEGALNVLGAYTRLPLDYPPVPPSKDSAGKAQELRRWSELYHQWYREEEPTWAGAPQAIYVAKREVGMELGYRADGTWGPVPRKP